MTHVLASSDGAVRKPIAYRTVAIDSSTNRNGNQITNSVLLVVWFSRPRELLTETLRVEQVLR